MNHSAKRSLALLFILIATSSSFAQKKTIDIGILLDKRTLKIDSLLHQMKWQISAVVGEDAVIRFPNEYLLTNEFSSEKALINYRDLTAKTDLILAFGLVNANVLGDLDTFDNPTILFGALNKDLSNLELSQQTSGTENFTYLIKKESYLDDLKVFQKLTGFKKVGVLIERPLVKRLNVDEVFSSIFQELKADFKIIPFDSVGDISDGLVDVDAVYMAGGFLLNQEEVKKLAQLIIDKKLPSFTSLGTEAVHQGIMATNQSDDSFDQFIRRIALSVEGFINGESLAEMPVFIESNNHLTLNYNTAQKVGVPIKYSLINSTTFVGEIKNSLSRKTFNALEIIDLALARNLTLLSGEKEVALTGQDVRIAKSSYLPSITASSRSVYVDPDLAAVSLGQNPEFSTTGNITLQQVLFSEASNANIRIQRKLNQAQEEAYKATALDIVFDGFNVYFNALILKANLQIQMRNLELTRENLKIAEQNFAAGQTGKSDQLRFQSQLAQDKQAVIEAVNQLEQGYININQLLNYNLDEEIDIEDLELDGIFKEYSYEQLVRLLDNPVSREPFIAFLVEEAKKNAPELKSLKYTIEAVDRSLKLNTSGRFLPTLSLQGQYNQVFNRSGAGSTSPSGFELINTNYNVALNLSIPIVNQNQNNINRQINQIQIDQLTINQANTTLAIDRNIRSTVLNVINQISNIELSKISEQAAKEALSLTQSSYSNGAVTVIQLIDAQNNYLNAQLASTNAVYNYLINALQLERFLGYYFLLNSEEDNAAFNARFLAYLKNAN